MRVQTHSELHCHDTRGSILDGMGTPEEMLERCKELGIHSMAVTDHANQFAWYYFAELQKKYPEVKILYGIELYECFDHTIQDPDNKFFHLLAIAKDPQGITALNEIATLSELAHENSKYYGKPRVDIEQLKPFAEHLIVTSACMGSKLGKAKSYNEIKQYVQEYASVFPNFYLELQAHNAPDQAQYNRTMLTVANELSIPYIITSDVHYVSIEKRDAHSRFVNINRRNADVDEQSSGLQKSLDIYEGCYLHSTNEMYEIMEAQGLTERQITSALQNTIDIADSVTGKVEFHEPEMPHITIPAPYKSEEEWFKAMIFEGWNTKITPCIKDGLVYDKHGVGRPVKVYKDRMIEELTTMTDMGFIGYHLIVADIIQWAKSQGIAVAWGRGSAAGSIVNYLTDITNIDPIPYNLLFSRYINKDRISLCDIDTDFQSDRRWEVFEYIKQTYGINNVAQIINFSEMTPKVALKDAGRSLNIPLSDINAIAEFMNDKTIEKCMEAYSNVQVFTDYVIMYPELFNLAKQFQGRTRNIATNACGSVISSKPIYEYCGQLKGDDGQPLLQVDKIICEKLGMVKLDILGTKVLQMIDSIMKMLGKNFYDVEQFPLDDIKTYNLLASGRLYGVFQLEGFNMTQFFKKLKPKNILDICAGIALYRPASIKFLGDYINFKDNPDQIEYPHEAMGEILDETFSIIVYQEQIMHLLQALAGFSFAQADLVRRGIGKKQLSYIMAQKEAFIFGDAERGIKGCIANGLTQEQSETIFKVMIDAGAYCFNKSHALSYAMITYSTAYLKAHNPLEFMTVLLSISIADNVSVTKYMEECKLLGIEILPPDINIAKGNFTMVDGKIMYGMTALNGMGLPKISQILAKQPYSSYEDFIDRNVTNVTDNEIKLDKSSILSLIGAGCFDNFGKSRIYLLQKYFFENTSQVKKCTTVQVPEMIDSGLIPILYQDELDLYGLHKQLTKKKWKIAANDELFYTFKNYYEDIEDIYKLSGMELIIDQKIYKKAYEKKIGELKDFIKDSNESLTIGVNKKRVIVAYTEYLSGRTLADLEFLSTGTYFSKSWLEEIEEANKESLTILDEMPNIILDNSNRYKKKELYAIVGTVVGKIKTHKQLILLTSCGIILVKLGDKLFNSIASELSRCSKVVISGYLANGFFMAEYYEDTRGKSDKSKALKIL